MDQPPRTTDTDRLETFSDAVFAIALTLLVLDLPAPEPGRFLETLTTEWSTYLAYLISFLTIGSIWLSHHNAISHINRADPLLLLLNLLLLLGASLVPWPTALISSALLGGQHADQVVAILVFALVTALVGLPWFLLSLRLSRRPQLLKSPADAHWMRRNAWASPGSVVGAVVGAGLAFAAPLVALALFLTLPALFLLDSLRTPKRHQGN